MHEDILNRVELIKKYQQLFDIHLSDRTVLDDKISQTSFGRCKMLTNIKHRKTIEHLTAIVEKQSEKLKDLDFQICSNYHDQLQKELI